MDAPDAVSSLAADALARPPIRLPRWIAALEVLLISGVPTQVMVAGGLVAAAGFRWPGDGPGSLAFLATLSFVDTLVVVGLIAAFLKLAGERPAQVFLGSRPWRRDLVRGLAMVPVVFLLVAVLVTALRTFAPWTHTVQTNPLEAFVDRPIDAAVFLMVAIVAGGVREELQRAFVLHRFDQYLGGARVGLVLFSVLFGALHVDQGLDVAIAIGCLGLWWGVVYIRHRSAVLPMANHAAFNAVQVLQAFLVRTTAG